MHTNPAKPLSTLDNIGGTLRNATIGRIKEELTCLRTTQKRSFLKKRDKSARDILCDDRVPTKLSHHGQH